LDRNLGIVVDHVGACGANVGETGGFDIVFEPFPAARQQSDFGPFPTETCAGN
jgi:hypothetical protein